MSNAENDEGPIAFMFALFIVVFIVPPYALWLWITRQV